MTYDEFNEECMLMIEEEKRRFHVAFLSEYEPRDRQAGPAQAESSDACVSGDKEEVSADVMNDDPFDDTMMVPLWEGDLFGLGLTYSVSKLYQLRQVHGMDYVRRLLRAQIRSVAVAGRSYISRSYRNMLSPEDQILYDRLRKVRSRLARENGRPSYTILSNRGLYDLCIKKPGSTAQLETVFGFGEINTKKYGALFLDEIAAFLQEAESAGEDTHQADGGFALSGNPDLSAEETPADPASGVSETKALYRSVSGKVIPFPFSGANP